MLLVLSFAGGIFIHAALTDDEQQRQEFETYYRIYSLSMPDQLVFAGEAVPLHDFDVQERYDRELLTNVYWQSQTVMMVKRANRFFPVIEKILQKNNIPDDMKYLVLAESGLQNVVSPAGAAGFWQMLDKTGRHYGLEVSEEVDERYHVEKATQAACNYMKEAYGEFGNWALVAASYNMGIDGVKRQLESQGVKNYYDLLLNTETSRYVFRTLAIKQIVESPEKYGFRIPVKHRYTQVPTVKVKVTKTIPDLAKFALDNGCNYKTLKLLNPWLRKSALTVAEGKSFYVSLPKDKVVHSDIAPKIVNDTIDQTNTHFEKITGTEDEVSVFEHKMQKGETVQKLAQRYGVKASEIRRMNNLAAGEEPKIGTMVRIHKTLEE